MQAAITPSFLDYTLNDYGFGISDIYNLPAVQSSFSLAPSSYVAAYETPVIDVAPISFVSASPVVKAVAPVANKTIAFTVSDKDGILPGANIAIDGIGKAQTDGNGYVIIPNVAPSSTVKITYVGYEDYIVSASSLPAKVVLKPTALQLDEVIVQAYKKPVAATNNNWLWWLAGALGAAVIYKKAKLGSKVIKAKI
jgi:hypothetical protein